MPKESRNRSFAWRLYKWLRRKLGPSVRELLRTGKILQTLWDATRLQVLQRQYYRQAGEIAVKLVREGKLNDIQIQRIMAKIERSDRILKRQDLLLRSYQQRGDVREVLRIDKAENRDNLEPV